ncbi:MAG: hypothetical protein BV456_07625 [Thermoplasmata archaeon M8B2D]|nr:MAG: hypothetical protein BV456_07625 [Thermoplasmata archaeon M8B2D]
MKKLFLLICILLVKNVNATDFYNGMKASVCLGQNDCYTGENYSKPFFGARNGPNGLGNISSSIWIEECGYYLVNEYWPGNDMKIFNFNNGVWTGMPFGDIWGRKSYLTEYGPENDLRWIFNNPNSDFEECDTNDPNPCSGGMFRFSTIDPIRRIIFLADVTNQSIYMIRYYSDCTIDKKSFAILGKKDFSNGLKHGTGQYIDPQYTYWQNSEYGFDCWCDSECPDFINTESPCFCDQTANECDTGWTSYDMELSGAATAFVDMVIPENGCTTIPNACSFNEITGIAAMPDKGILAVADNGNNRLVGIDYVNNLINGKPATIVVGSDNLQSVGTFGLGANIFAGLQGLTYAQDIQMLYVMSGRGQRIMSFNVSNGFTSHMSASYPIGATDFTSYVGESAITQGSIFDSWGLSYDSTDDRLLIADNDIYAGGYLSRLGIWDLPGAYNGGSMTTVLGQQNFTSAVYNWQCPGENFDIGPCGNSVFSYALYIDKWGGIIAGLDDWNFRSLLYGSFTSVAPIDIIGDGNPETTTVENDGEIITVTFNDTGGQTYEVILPANTEPLDGSDAVSIEIENRGNSVGILTNDQLPDGETKSIKLPIVSTKVGKLCIIDESNAQFGGTCPASDRYVLPEPGGSNTYYIPHQIMISMTNTTLYEDNIITITGLLHSLVDELEDFDGDGLIDLEDCCPDSIYNIFNVGNKNMGDNQNIFGCTASDILEFKPGKNKEKLLGLGEYAHGISPGTQNVFENKIGWAQGICEF